MTLTSQAYFTAVSDRLERVANSQSAEIEKAADLISAAIQGGGVVHAFGAGHSEALAMEIAGRAGGLVPTNRLALRDIVLFGGEPTSVLADAMLERDPTVAERILALAPIAAGDVFVIASNSGVNGVVVELAHLVKQRGHALIAITSLEHTTRVSPRHPSGHRLADLADVVLDNGAPYGDAVLPLPEGGAIGAVSSITAATLAQMVVVEVVQRLLAAGERPPIYLSANIPGGDEHNHELEARYADRIRRNA
ncbi:SIS domain-containing protein [Micromonospora sp. DR5-3]|uniref:sugar isomerase domain-containing protein n=1 Tax=unclassified Micromonospora TaxID=2617518 RepID=UPI0011DA714D|nr:MULTISPECIES: SIS domain-containing protein [unclassified Micromonospora]MCW3820075.1 SIS domain-containing protein [Micromonospora sp. DR5-3]TYC19891.1 SIS domain-containing protein [Micromonospora sp. MP36]